MQTQSQSNSLFQLLMHHEKEFAQKVYLKQPREGVWHEFTWQDVVLQARKVAAFLYQAGLKRGDHVSIISKNCAEWFITDFGIHLAGMVNVPLFPNQNEDSAHFILEHAEVKLVFVGKLDDHQRTRHFIPDQYPTAGFDYHPDLKLDYKWTDVLAVAPLTDLIEPPADDLYTIIYTSGTSGTPKGAMYSNQTISNYLARFEEDLFRIVKKDHYKLVSYLPLAHIYERSAIQLGSLAINSDVSFVESLDKFSANLQTIQPTLFTAVPRIWSVFQQKIEQKLPSKRLDLLLKIPGISHLIKKKIHKTLGFDHCSNYFCGASHLPQSVMAFFDKLGIFIQEGYGQTENLAYVTVNLLPDRRIGYVGSRRLGVELRLGDDSELLMYSNCLMSGYYKEEQASKNAFTEDGWLRTGDEAEIDSHGRVKIVGRLSEVFKNQGGEFVTPSPIEKRFEGSQIIEHLCLVGKELPANVLLVTLNEHARVNVPKETVSQILQESLSRVNQGLAKHEKISRVIVVKDSWTTSNDCLTPTLKVRRKQVEKHYAALIHSVFAQKEKSMVVWEL